ncbi:MAG: SatD family protein [Microcella sp.]|uniref:SatD family protein n=1 Tax=Microcella sp. TaxID=1913979 RepID=UPI003315756D
MTGMRVALLVDIVDSRALHDRALAQSAILEAFHGAARGIPVEVPLWATVGDEFQAVFATVADAVRATALVRLALPVEIDCRFGLGEGEMREVGEGNRGPIYDGSAWWRAREALDRVERDQERTAPYARTWLIGEQSDAERVGALTAHLLLRDHLIGTMSPRARRLAAGTLSGATQSELAARERISQSAVSQNLRRSGAAALVAADRALAGESA